MGFFNATVTVAYAVVVRRAHATSEGQCRDSEDQEYYFHKSKCGTQSMMAGGSGELSGFRDLLWL